jgi:hypothetical protein
VLEDPRVPASADAKPADQSESELDGRLEALRGVLENDAVRFSTVMRERGVLPIILPE